MDEDPTTTWRQQLAQAQFNYQLQRPQPLVPGVAPAPLQWVNGVPVQNPAPPLPTLADQLAGTGPQVPSFLSGLVGLPPQGPLPQVVADDDLADPDARDRLRRLAQTVLAATVLAAGPTQDRLAQALLETLDLLDTLEDMLARGILVYRLDESPGGGAA